jgi:hypothetical protein
MRIADEPRCTQGQQQAEMTQSSVVSQDASPIWSTQMGEVIRFVPKSELERIRLIREARAIYDSIFPPGNSVAEPRQPQK